MNHLDAEPLIIDRLTAALITDARVASAANIAGAFDLTPQLPAVFVQPAAADVTDASSDGRATAQDEQWLVVVVVPLVPDPVDFSKNYGPAGLLIGKVVDALAGWKPGTMFRAMRYLGREEPAFEAGHAEFPLRFALKRAFSTTGA